MILYQRMRQYLIYILLLHKIQFIMQSPAILHRLTTPVAYGLQLLPMIVTAEIAAWPRLNLVVTKKNRTKTVIHTGWQQARGTATFKEQIP